MPSLLTRVSDTDFTHGPVQCFPSSLGSWLDSRIPTVSAFYILEVVNWLADFLIRQHLDSEGALFTLKFSFFCETGNTR